MQYCHWILRSTYFPEADHPGHVKEVLSYQFDFSRPWTYPSHYQNVNAFVTLQKTFILRCTLNSKLVKRPDRFYCAFQTGSSLERSSPFYTGPSRHRLHPI